jgi:dTDP-4-dehydrorhamnose reductase
MQVIVLGQSGMLGSMVMRIMREESTWTVGGTQSEQPAAPGFFDATLGIDQLDSIIPDGSYVINCAGITSWKMDPSDPASMQRAILVNSIFPQRLAAYAEKRNLKVIHMSTDGVFSGNGGPYKEDDLCDCTDAYGKTKVLGEAVSKNVINVRTSIIGPSLNGEGHLARFLEQAQGAEVNGFTNTSWNGVTTLQFAKMCHKVIREGVFDELRSLSPVLHFAPNEMVTKLELYSYLRDTFRPDMTITPAEDPRGGVTRELETEFPEWQAFVGRSDLESAIKEILDKMKVAS